jgi:nucleoside triphosphate diphosphatase
MDKPAPREFDALVAIMARLRDPETGCPWDVAQNFATIAPYTLEEAYEVADAIARDDMSALPDELGDLLLQVVFHSRMAEEQNTFNINDVIGQICDKMERRHPHIFGDTPADDADAVVANCGRPARCAIRCGIGPPFPSSGL